MCDHLIITRPHRDIWIHCELAVYEIKIYSGFAKAPTTVSRDHVYTHWQTAASLLDSVGLCYAQQEIMGNNILIRPGLTNSCYAQLLWETFTIKLKTLRLAKLWIPKRWISSETLSKANKAKANKGTISHPSYRNSVEKSLEKLRHIHRHVTVFKVTSLWVSVIQTN